ncbi:site-specific DNA-methyltransferase [Streptomyces collinus]|uniref:site-specific DNA-methyltransferase n=1 Tax=Streptomyces collinus TaxID=42684 RepID=UPI0036BDFC2F
MNNPTADAFDLVTEAVEAAMTWRGKRDFAKDPQLVWKGKDEQDRQDLEVPAPPIFRQERIEPRYLVKQLMDETKRRRESEGSESAGEELSLFGTEFFDDGILDELDKVDWYNHQMNWTNRMILGDSLQVMASLAERENLRGKAQMVYIDPPYGIKFGSNWQARIDIARVRDGKLEDVTREVEQIKAFRDTWELGISSYLSYLRDRVTTARDLLAESGSVFLQIGDENVHLVRALLDEVFGSENFVSLITYKTTSGAGSFAGGTNVLAAVSNYIVWYARDITKVKYRQLFDLKGGDSGAGEYRLIEFPDGSRRNATAEELVNTGEGRLYRLDNLISQTTRVGQTTVFPVSVDGVTITPKSGGWKTNRQGMARLLSAKRVVGRKNSLGYVRYLDDFPCMAKNNMWSDTVIAGRPGDKTYVVQTSAKVIERCMLMATDPGDLVLDPTCGSGTTAYVAEQWGRRWITIDTSRVAIALARHRIMGAKYPAYLLADSPEGKAKEAEISQQPLDRSPSKHDVRRGFVYERVPHITLKSIANNPDIKEGMTREQIDKAIKKHAEFETLYDRPYENKKAVRVAGAFTVESLSPHRSVSFDQEVPASEKAAEMMPSGASYEETILEHVKKAGVQNGYRNERLEFESVEPVSLGY